MSDLTEFAIMAFGLNPKGFVGESDAKASEEILLTGIEHIESELHHLSSYLLDCDRDDEHHLAVTLGGIRGRLEALRWLWLKEHGQLATIESRKEQKQ